MKNRKLFKQLLIFLSCITFFITSPSQSTNIRRNNNYAYYYTEKTDDINIKQLYDLINSSIYLTQEEKDALYNEDYLIDLLNTINNSEYLKQKIKMHFTNINIESMEIETTSSGRTIYGRYYLNIPSTLFVGNYEGINNENIDYLIHEYVHLCQELTSYNLIHECCAEIISYDFFDNMKINAYKQEIIRLKILMEIIGNEPIWYYTITGDFSKIEQAVKPYLTYEEYCEFLYDLSFDTENDSDNEQKLESLDRILSTLYYYKYNENIEDNYIINLIKKADNNLCRYYFNYRKITPEYSYYLDYENGSYQTVDLQTAIDYKKVFISSLVMTPIDTETALKLLETDEYFFGREIISNDASIIIISTINSGGKYYITGYINGEYYNKIDVDELVRQGIIKANYWIIDLKYLNAEDYINHNYNEEAQIHIQHNSDTIINDDNTVYCYMPTKIYLPTINDRNNNLTLKKQID